MKKKIIYTILLFIWMLVIFMFSSQNGTNSQKTSDVITDKVVSTIEHVKKEKLDKNDTSLIVRKLAHFIEYFILGILAYLTISNYNIKNPLICSILICIMYASLDEAHQIFSIGRSPKILDVIIDSCGSVLAILIKKHTKPNKKYVKNVDFISYL